MGSPPEHETTINVPFTERVEWLAFAGAVLLVVGSFMTWVSAGPFRVPGTDGDGWFTVAGGVLAGVLAWRARWAWAGLVGGLCLALVLWKLSDISSAADESWVAVEPGGGLYLCLVGAAVTAGCSLWRWRWLA